jgi:hypothetical protein
MHKGNDDERMLAVGILCAMDRYVPPERLLWSDIGLDVNLPWLRAAGLIDPFRPVDGRRIGREGYEAIKWAEEQKDNDDLRFHAQQCTGSLEQQLRDLRPGEQIRRWRAAIIKSRGFLGGPDESWLYTKLQQIIGDRAPESLPLLTDMLDHDKNGYVRLGIFNILHSVDVCRLRLVGSEAGQAAIAAMGRAVRQGNFKPPLRHTQEDAEQTYRELSGGERNIGLDTRWDWYAYAMGRLYGEELTTNPNYPYGREKAIPEIHDFIDHLSSVDPTFPSWEYTFWGNPADETLHPLFQKKLQRYYEEWQRFKAEHHIITRPFVERH